MRNAVLTVFSDASRRSTGGAHSADVGSVMQQDTAGKSNRVVLWTLQIHVLF
jgi:hypothetical protein